MYLVVHFFCLPYFRPTLMSTMKCWLLTDGVIAVLIRYLPWWQWIADQDRNDTMALFGC
jgi:hypothetical protein